MRIKRSSGRGQPASLSFRVTQMDADAVTGNDDELGALIQSIINKVKYADVPDAIDCVIALGIIRIIWG